MCKWLLPYSALLATFPLLLVFISCSVFLFASMYSSVPFVMSPKSKVLTFQQRGGENFKDAWKRILEARKKIQPMLAMSILLDLILPFYLILKSSTKINSITL